MERVFEDTMAKKSPSLRKTISPHIQEAQRIPKNVNKTIPTYTLNFLKLETILKADRRKYTSCAKEHRLRRKENVSSETRQWKMGSSSLRDFSRNKGCKKGPHAGAHRRCRPSPSAGEGPSDRGEAPMAAEPQAHSDALRVSWASTTPLSHTGDAKLTVVKGSMEFKTHVRVKT